jgi:hypothetical protein
MAGMRQTALVSMAPLTTFIEGRTIKAKRARPTV